MSDSSLPIDIPVAPPSYEEAIQTSAPELPTLETSENDEPPPSYIEATRDDSPNRGYRPLRISNSSNASELANLIIASILNSRRPDEGREPIIQSVNSTESLESGQPSRRSHGQPRGRRAVAVRVPSSLSQTARKTRIRFCLMGIGISMFVIAGLIAISYASGRKYYSDDTRKVNSHFTAAPVFDWSKYTPPTVDWSKYIHPPNDFQKDTPSPMDIDDMKELDYTTTKPFNIKPLWARKNGFSSNPAYHFQGKVAQSDTSGERQLSFDQLFKKLEKEVESSTRAPNRETSN